MNFPEAVEELEGSLPDLGVGFVVGHSLHVCRLRVTTQALTAHARCDGDVRRTYGATRCTEKTLLTPAGVMLSTTHRGISSVAPNARRARMERGSGRVAENREAFEVMRAGAIPERRKDSR